MRCEVVTEVRSPTVGTGSRAMVRGRCKRTFGRPRASTVGFGSGAAPCGKALPKSALNASCHSTTVADRLRSVSSSQVASAETVPRTPQLRL